MIQQLVSLAGAILVLAAYVAITRRWLRTRDPLYNLMNLAIKVTHK